MLNTATVLDRCRKLGLTLRTDGDLIAISPGGVIPADLLKELRAVRDEVLSILREGERLGADEIPWLHTAHQILCGEFKGADRSTLQSLAMGLRTIRHRKCLEALKMLRACL